MFFQNRNLITKRFASWQAVLFFALISLAGCKAEPETLGTKLQPEGSTLGLITSDTFSILSQTRRVGQFSTDAFKEEELQSDKAVSSFNYAGVIEDEVFGSSKYGFYTNFNLELDELDLSGIAAERELNVESVTLNIRMVESFGDTLHPVNYNVFLIDQPFVTSDSLDYSYNSSFVTQPATFLGRTEEPLLDVFNFNKDTAVLSIELDKEYFKENILEKARIEGAIPDNDAFLDLFPGIYVEVDTIRTNITSLNPGVLYLFSLRDAETNITIKYSTQDASGGSVVDKDVIKFPIANSNQRVNVVSHQLEGTDPLLQSTNAAHTPEVNYVMSNGGYNLELRFPSLLKALSTEGDITINYAELFIPFNDSVNDLPSIGGFLAFTRNESKEFDFIADYIISSDFVGGSFLDERNGYSIRLSQHIVQHLKEYRKDSSTELTLVLRPEVPQLTNNIFGKNTVNSGSHPSNPMRLTVSYTPIN